MKLLLPKLRQRVQHNAEHQKPPAARPLEIFRDETLKVLCFLAVKQVAGERQRLPPLTCRRRA